ncbi:MAG: hypothetical protein R3A48_25660 [Polyangiales bacterium]
MNGVPIQTYLLPLVMLVVVAFMYARGMKARATMLQDNPQYGLGVLSQRWQLQMLEGDPSYNLFINSRDAEVASHAPPIAGMSADTPAHTARMEGVHRDHPVRFEFYDQTHIERGIIEITYTRHYRCALTVGVRAAFPPFEITLRTENQYLVTERKTPLPESTFGQGLLDQALKLYAADPRVGPTLAPTLGALCAMTYVHVVGGDGAVRFEMSPLGPSYGVYYAETVLQVLLAVADVLEGRQPVIPAPPPPPMS